MLVQGFHNVYALTNLWDSEIVWRKFCGIYMVSKPLTSEELLDLFPRLTIVVFEQVRHIFKNEETWFFLPKNFFNIEK